MAWGMFLDGPHKHVIPLEDLREHEIGCGCWCRPTLDEDDDTILAHHSMDGRETYEHGRKLQ